MEHLVEAEGLRKVYPDGTLAVDGVSYTAGSGVTVFMGPNGSGKTTTMAMTAGALRPTAGTVRVCGYDMWSGDWAKPRSCVGYAPQDMPFREKLTAEENLVWYGLIRGLSLRESKRRASQLLEMVGLEGAGSKKVAELSGGMRRRLAIAAAMMGDPPVLLLDEPTSGLDPAARESIWRLLRGLAGQGRAVIASTHIPDEAEKYGDIVYIFHRGRIVASGRPGDLIERYARDSRITVIGQLPVTARVEGAKLLQAGETRLVYATPDPDSLLPRLLERLLAVGARIERVEVSKPGLAEAYLTLTGESPYTESSGR